MTGEQAAQAMSAKSFRVMTMGRPKPKIAASIQRGDVLVVRAVFETFDRIIIEVIADKSVQEIAAELLLD